MANRWQRSQWAWKSLRWCHSSTLGTAHLQMVVVNSLPWQDAMSHGPNSMSSCPPPPPHFPSPPGGNYTTHTPGASYSMEWKPRSQPFLFCIAYKDQVSSQHLPERMQLDDLAKALCTCWLRWHGHVEHSCGWLKKVQKLNPIRGHGHGHPKKTLAEVICLDCLALDLTDTHPSNCKTWSDIHRIAIRLNPSLYRGLVKSGINQIWPTMMMMMVMTMMLMMILIIMMVVCVNSLSLLIGASTKFIYGM